MVGDHEAGPAVPRAGQARRADGDPPARVPAASRDPPAVPGGNLEGRPGGRMVGDHEAEPAVRGVRVTAIVQPGSPVAEPRTPGSGPATYPDGCVTRSAA